MKTREKILLHTKQVITTEGVHAVSGRKICEDLGLNISLIHYHFGNKETLIREALQQLTEETLTFTDILFDENVSIDKRLYDFFFRMLQEFTVQPEIAKQILVGKSHFPTEHEQVLSNKLLVFLLEQLNGRGINLSVDIFRMRVLQIISAIAYPAELGLFENLTDSMREEYVQTLVNQLLLKE